ncbi:inositol monophosphatase [Candidatus Peregrinibacteria bacterium]|nr:inositol monophosphatase [Candidatus Peregrinibacteria bacterium]
MYENYLQLAQSLAKKGGKVLTDNFGKLNESDVENKGIHDVVTYIDKQIEKMYTDEIKKTFPKHGIIGEEGTSNNPDNEFVWVIDPLDGTRNYTIQVPFYATTLCLLQNKEPVMSVIYIPSIDKMYSAVKGGGAFLNEKQIKVSKETELIKSSVLYCHKADEQLIRKTEKSAVELKLKAYDADRLRSAGAEMGLIAEGLCDAYFLDGLPVWDMAAGSILIREAGGKVTDFNGKEWECGDSSILLSNGTKIHEEIIDIINK